VIGVCWKSVGSPAESNTILDKFIFQNNFQLRSRFLDKFCPPCPTFTKVIPQSFRTIGIRSELLVLQVSLEAAADHMQIAMSVRASIPRHKLPDTFRLKSCSYTACLSVCHLLSRWYIPRLVRLWRRRWYILPKRRWTFNGLHGVISHTKIEDGLVMNRITSASGNVRP
jgi:hypothetical protein